MARDRGRNGDDIGTGGRLRKVAHYLEGDDTFCMTYGDGISDLNITASIAFHKAHGKLATVTAVQPPARFGGLGLEGTAITEFQEKLRGEGGLINSFFVLSPAVFKEIKDASWMFD